MYHIRMRPASLLLPLAVLTPLGAYRVMARLVAAIFHAVSGST